MSLSDHGFNVASAGSVPNMTMNGALRAVFDADASLTGVDRTRSSFDRPEEAGIDDDHLLGGSRSRVGSPVGAPTLSWIDACVGFNCGMGC